MRFDGTVSDDDRSGSWAPLADLGRIGGILREAAQQERTISYSELLNQLGFRFSRPKMRALCKTLDAIDRDGAARGEPELAVLVVRESDGLPGQGWWIGRVDHDGAWTGAEARAYHAAIAASTFDYWSKRQ